MVRRFSDGDTAGLKALIQTKKEEEKAQFRLVLISMSYMWHLLASRKDATSSISG